MGRGAARSRRRRHTEQGFALADGAAAFLSSARLWGRFRGFGPATLDPLGPEPGQESQEREPARAREAGAAGFAPCALEFDTLLTWCRQHFRGRKVPKVQLELLATGVSLANEAAAAFRRGGGERVAAASATPAGRPSPSLPVDGPYHTASIAGLAALSAFAAGTQRGWARGPDGEPFTLDQALALVRECGPEVAAFATLVPLRRRDGVRLGGEPAAAGDRSRGAPVARCLGPQRAGGGAADHNSAADALLATEAIIGAQLLAGPVPTSARRSPPQPQAPSTTSRLCDPPSDCIDEEGAAPIGDESPTFASLAYPHRRLLLQLFAGGPRAPVLDAEGVARPLRRSGRAPPRVAVSQSRTNRSQMPDLSLPPGPPLSAADLDRAAIAAWECVTGADGTTLARWTAARAAVEEAAARWRACGAAARPPGIAADWDVCPDAGPVTRVVMLAPEAPADEGDPCAPPLLSRALALAAARHAVCLSPGTLVLAKETLEQLLPQGEEDSLGVAEPGPLWHHLPQGSVPRALLALRALLLSDGDAAAAALVEHPDHPLASDVRAAAVALADAVLGDTAATSPPPACAFPVAPALHPDADHDADSARIAALRVAAQGVRDAAGKTPSECADAVRGLGAALGAVDRAITLDAAAAVAAPPEGEVGAAGTGNAVPERVASPPSAAQSDAEPSFDGEGPPPDPATAPPSALQDGGPGPAGEDTPVSPKPRPGTGPSAELSPVVSSTTSEGPVVAAGTSANAELSRPQQPVQPVQPVRSTPHDVLLVTAACSGVKPGAECVPRPSAESGGLGGEEEEEEEDEGWDVRGGSDEVAGADSFSPSARVTLRKLGLDPAPNLHEEKGREGRGVAVPWQRAEPCPPPVSSCAFGPMPSHQHASLIVQTCGGDLSRARLRDVLALAMRGSTCAANQTPGPSSIPMVECTRCGVWNHDVCETRRRALFHRLRAHSERQRGADGVPAAFCLTATAGGPAPAVHSTMAYAVSVMASAPVVEEPLAPMPDAARLAKAATADHGPAFRAQSTYFAEQGSTPAGSRRLYRALAARWREACSHAVALGLREGPNACTRLRDATTEAIFSRFSDDSDRVRKAAAPLSSSIVHSLHRHGSAVARSVGSLALRENGPQRAQPAAPTGPAGGAGDASHPHLCTLCMWELADWREQGRPGAVAPSPAGTAPSASHAAGRWVAGEEEPHRTELELVAREMFVQERQRRCGCGVRRSCHLERWAKSDLRQRELWRMDARREWYRLRLLEDREALLRVASAKEGADGGRGEGAGEAPAETLLASASLLPPLLGAQVPAVGVDASVSWHAAVGRDLIARAERPCAHNGCFARAKHASQYCSHACGVAAAEASLRGSLATAVEAGSAWSALQREAAAVAGRLSAAAARRSRVLQWQIACIREADQELAARAGDQRQPSALGSWADSLTSAEGGGGGAADAADAPLLAEERVVMAPLLQEVGRRRRRREELEAANNKALRQRSWLRAAMQAVRALRQLERCMWLSDVGRGVLALAVVTREDERSLETTLRFISASTARGLAWVREAEGVRTAQGPAAGGGGTPASSLLSCPLCLERVAPRKMAHHMVGCTQGRADPHVAGGGRAGPSEDDAMSNVCGFLRDRAGVLDAGRRIMEGGVDLVLALCRLSMLFNSTEGNTLAGMLQQLQPVERARVRRLLYCARTTVSGSTELAFARYLTFLSGPSARAAVLRPVPTSGWPPAGREPPDWGLSLRWLRAVVRLGEALKTDGGSETVRSSDAHVGARAAAAVHSDVMSRVSNGGYTATSRTTPWTDTAGRLLSQAGEQSEAEARIAECWGDSQAAVAAAKTEDGTDLNLRSSVTAPAASVVKHTLKLMREAGAAAATLTQGLSELCHHTCGEPGAACRRHVAWEAVQDVALASSSARAQNQKHHVVMDGRDFLGRAPPLREWQSAVARHPVWRYVPVPVPGESDTGATSGPDAAHGGGEDAVAPVSPRLWRGGDHVLAIGSVGEDAEAAAVATPSEAVAQPRSLGLMALAKRRRLRGTRSAPGAQPWPVEPARAGREVDREDAQRVVGARKRPRQEATAPLLHPAALCAPPPQHHQLQRNGDAGRGATPPEGVPPLAASSTASSSAGSASGWVTERAGGAEGAQPPVSGGRTLTALGSSPHEAGRLPGVGDGQAPPQPVAGPAALGEVRDAAPTQAAPSAVLGAGAEQPSGKGPQQAVAPSTHHGTVTRLPASAGDSVASAPGHGGRVYFGRRSNARPGWRNGAHQ